jgi:type I restriction enzyme S subunit
LKKGWQTKTLGDVCAFDKIQGIHRGLPYVGLEHIESHTARFIGSNEPQPVKSSTFRFSSQHVLYGRLRPYLNKALAPDFDGHCSTEIFPLKPYPELSREFLLYWLLADETCDRVNATCTGARMPRAQMNEVLDFEFPLPPLTEQQRIVGLLDEAFEGLATAKANAEKNLQNARALFESQLQSVFTQRGLGWVDRTLDEVCIVERGSSPRPIKDYFTTDTNGVNWIKIGDTEEGGKYVYTTSQKITPEGASQSRFVKEGDFILTNSMSYGRPYIMKTSGYIHDGWFVLRLNMAIDTDYFYYLLSSPVVQLQFAALASGSVVKNISGDLVKKAVLPIPPLEQQHIIVEKLLALSAETQRLARIYEQKLAALDALKKSLLHQAFSGEL